MSFRLIGVCVCVGGGGGGGLLMLGLTTVRVKIKFPFTVRLSTVYRLNGNSFSCVFSVHTTDKLNMCSVISTS